MTHTQEIIIYIYGGLISVCILFLIIFGPPLKRDYNHKDCNCDTPEPNIQIDENGNIYETLDDGGKVFIRKSDKPERKKAYDQLKKEFEP